MAPSLSHTHLVQTNPDEYPLQFDTRNQNIPLQQIIQDNTFFPVDLTNANNNNNNQQDSSNNQDNQSTDSKQYLQTFNPSTTLINYLFFNILLFSFDRTNSFTKLYGTKFIY
jgi:hypothetical protein